MSGPGRFLMPFQASAAVTARVTDPRFAALHASLALEEAGGGRRSWTHFLESGEAALQHIGHVDGMAAFRALLGLEPTAARPPCTPPGSVPAADGRRNQQASGQGIVTPVLHEGLVRMRRSPVDAAGTDRCRAVYNIRRGRGSARRVGHWTRRRKPWSSAHARGTSPPTRR